MKFRFQRAFFVLLLALLLWLTAEILFRRWVYGQIPAQLPSGAVYGLLTVNVAVIAAFLKKEWLKRTGKN